MSRLVGVPQGELTAFDTDEADFTEDHYSEILDAAMHNYAFATFTAIPWDKQFVLWRHDIDVSLNRALRLAELESARGITATYFIDIHSTFYNALEASQSSAIRGIVALGHRLGVHFDANYYEVQDESRLEELVEREAAILSETFAAPVDAMSFHNPSELHLTWTRDCYAGLVNCYSQRMRKFTAYCSDSKGYWRHRRLFDVVSRATDQRLQVLTHPELWQLEPMAPRQRLWRAAFGRARAGMRHYDELSSAMGRLNITGRPTCLSTLEPFLSEEFWILDLLWNEGRLAALVSELEAIYERITLNSLGNVCTPATAADAANDVADSTDFLSSAVEKMCHQIRVVLDPESLED